MFIFKQKWFNLRHVRMFCAEPQITVRRRGGVTDVRRQENLMINQMLQKKENFDSGKWMEIRKELLDTAFSMTESNVDTTIITRCSQASNRELIVDYMRFLISINHKLNMGTVKKFFVELYQSGKPLCKEETEIVFKCYDYIKTEYSFLEPDTAQYCILCLSLTNRWREYKDLLEMAQYDGTIIPGIHNAIATAAFDDDDPNTGWEHLKSISARQIRLEPLKSYLNYCIRISNNTKELESHIFKQFQFWAVNEFYPNFEVLALYTECLENTGKWSASETKIDKKKSCLVCAHHLVDMEITETDFNLLRENFFSKVVVGSDVYCNTTPEELHRFGKFVNSTKPYDVVIDGLNIGYLHHNRDKGCLGQELVNVIKKYVAQNKKIFVLGRKHMQKWPTAVMNYVKANTYLYLANNLSRDDPFLLHAALSSGMHTYLVSRDDMRQHRFHLKNPHLQSIFRRWQLRRQVRPVNDTLSRGRIVWIYPSNFNIIAQMNPNDTWHIPYNQLVNDDGLPQYSWLCLKRK